MSTHGCFAPSFSPFPFFSDDATRDVGAQEPDAIADAYYYMETDDDQE